MSIAEPPRKKERLYEYMGTDRFRCQRCGAWTDVQTVHLFSPKHVLTHHQEQHGGPATFDCSICRARDTQNYAAVCPDCFAKTERELLGTSG